jgi:hypothetical protein
MDYDTVDEKIKFDKFIFQIQENIVSVSSEHIGYKTFFEKVTEICTEALCLLLEDENNNNSSNKMLDVKKFEQVRKDYLIKNGLSLTQYYNHEKYSEFKRDIMSIYLKEINKEKNNNLSKNTTNEFKNFRLMKRAEKISNEKEELLFLNAKEEYKQQLEEQINSYNEEINRLKEMMLKIKDRDMLKDIKLEIYSYKSKIDDLNNISIKLKDRGIKDDRN